MGHSARSQLSWLEGGHQHAPSGAPVRFVSSPTCSGDPPYCLAGDYPTVTVLGAPSTCKGSGPRRRRRGSTWRW